MAQALHHMMSVNLTAIPTIGVNTALVIAAEIGPDQLKHQSSPQSMRPVPYYYDSLGAVCSVALFRLLYQPATGQEQSALDAEEGRAY